MQLKLALESSFWLHFWNQQSPTLQTGTFSICLPFSGCLKFPFGVKVSCHIVVEVKTPKWFYSEHCFIFFLVVQCRWQKYFCNIFANSKMSFFAKTVLLVLLSLNKCLLAYDKGKNTLFVHLSFLENILFHLNSRYFKF